MKKSGEEMFAIIRRTFLTEKVKKSKSELDKLVVKLKTKIMSEMTS